MRTPSPRRRSRPILLCALLASLIMGAAGLARADLLIIPIRIYFLERDRVQDMTLVNTSDKAAVFKISWLHQKQVEHGGYQPQEEPLNPQYNPADMIVFSPRQITLPPNGKQRVRMSLRRPADLPDGEYRAHIQMQRVGTPPRMADPSQKAPMAVGVIVHVGFAVPVVVRQGTYNATAQLASTPGFIPATANDKRPYLEFKIRRQGNFSTNGNVLVYWSGQGKSEQLVGRLNGVNIYPELEVRHIRIPLEVDSIPSGTLRILYEGDGPDKGITYFSESFPIGG